ncbi:MAG: 2,3,4,5-tetrahydropyridine-2,6-dicarboxylate N-succinyltransferase [Proteobacteria bacterium]|nr:2,3,4,5-tetrahydropyridine-2,6-dicarboxylate N-succinyltransferase [Pseudomonadota bacterium]
MQDLQKIIEEAFLQIDQLRPGNIPEQINTAVLKTINLLDSGQIRVAEKTSAGWQVNQWVKQAILLSFRTHSTHVIDGGFTRFYDKLPLKYAAYDENAFQATGIRTVPPATVRKGAYLSPNTILMPCFVNIGAYVGAGSLIDTWASVGSCAQIGKNVHISAGAGIGGVLEPLQANPTIIEDDCFIGARSEVAEGVIVEQGAVLSMGVFITQSTPIYNRETKEIIYGRVPAGSVIIPGSLPSADGSYGRHCVVIVKQVDAKTRQKVSINELLRVE